MFLWFIRHRPITNTCIDEIRLLFSSTRITISVILYDDSLCQWNLCNSVVPIFITYGFQHLLFFWIFQVFQNSRCTWKVSFGKIIIFHSGLKSFEIIGKIWNIYTSYCNLLSTDKILLMHLNMAKKLNYRFNKLSIGLG